MRTLRATWAAGVVCLLAMGCGDDDSSSSGDDVTDGTDGEMTDATDSEMTDGTDELPEPKDPNEADVVEVDRFSEEAATLMVRTDDNGLPDPNEPIDFDEPPFITQGLGPDGQMVEYYNFDVQPTEPAPIYVLWHEDGTMVEDQLNIVDVIPGDEGYNDFWQVVFVTVPDDYVGNTYTSATELEAADLGMEGTETLVNCPVVPAGSMATKRYEGDDMGLHQGWYQDKVVNYFTFDEANLMGTSVPLSPIYVAFNVNPEDEGGGPASGFVTEEGREQTHNVVQTLPGDEDYSPLWLVNVYDNADFDAVSDLESAMDAEQLAAAVATVNCPIVTVGN